MQRKPRKLGKPTIDKPPDKPAYSAGFSKKSSKEPEWTWKPGGESLDEYAERVYGDEARKLEVTIKEYLRLLEMQVGIRS